MPYLDGHDRRLLKELRPEREVYAPPFSPGVVKFINVVSFFLALYAVVLWG